MPQARDEAGNIWETDAQGNAVRLVSHAAAAPQSGSLPIGPRNTYKMPQEAASLDNTQAATTGKVLDNRVAAATVVPQIRQVGAEADKTAAQAANAQQDLRLNGLPAATYQQALNQFNGAGMIYSAAQDMRDKFNQGPGSTSGLGGGLDFLPLPSNQRFDKAADAARGQVVQGLALTGGSVNSPGEAQLWTGPYVPRSSDYDQTNIDTFNRLDTMRNNAAKTAIMTLGGVPDDTGRIHPLGSPEAAAALAKIGLPANFGMPGQGGQNGGVPPMAAGGTMGGPDNGGGGNPGGGLSLTDYADRSTQSAGPVRSPSGFLAGPATRQEYDTDYQKKADAMFRAGASYDELNQFSIQSGHGGIPPASYARSRKAFDDYKRAHGGREYNGYMMEAPLKTVEQTWGQRLQQGNPGSLAIGAANGATFGAADLIAPDKMAMVRNAHPYTEMGGEALGAIAGTKGLGVVGGRLASPLAKLAPETIAALRGSGTTATAARNLAGDVGYGMVRGGISDPEHPLAGALLGGAAAGGGSVLGQGAAGGVGKLIGGLKANPLAQYLASKGVPMTTGQMLGGTAKSLEDRLAGLPGFGVIGKRRGEAFNGFNRAAFDEAGSSVNAATPHTGEQGVRSLLDQTGQAYDNATAGVQVPLDSQFQADMAGVRSAGANLPPDLAGKFDAALNNRMLPIATSGELTGDAYQQAQRGLSGYKAEHTKPGFEQDYRGALTQAQAALRSQMERGGGASVIEGLGNADQAYRRAKVLADAVKRARNGTRSGEVQTFTPSQLVDAGWANAGKFGGNRPFAELADAGQAVLPNAIPDSGTAGRIAQYAAPAALVGGGQASDSMGWTDGAALKAALAYALLRGGGSKIGQAGINAALFKRPETLKKLGTAISKRKGLFGTAAVPLMLESQN